MSLSKIIKPIVDLSLVGSLLFAPIKAYSYGALRNGSWDHWIKNKVNIGYEEKDFNNGSTHVYISYVASKILETHELRVELQNYIHDFIRGAVVEDSLHNYVLRSFQHFYDYRTHKGLNPSNIISTNPDYNIKDLNLMSSLEWALSDENQFNFNNSIKHYLEGNLKEAYKCLGAISHLFQDLTVPAHSRSDIHPEGESYEKYCDKVYNIENLRNKQIPKLPEIKPLVLNSLPDYFNYISSISGRFPSDQSLPKNKTYLSESDLAYYAETLIPLAISSTAGFLEFFYDKIQEIKSKEDLPEKESTINKNNVESIIESLNKSKILIDKLVWVDENRIAMTSYGKLQIIDVNNKTKEEKNIGNVYAHRVSFCNDGSAAIVGVKDGYWYSFLLDEKNQRLTKISSCDDISSIAISKDCSKIVYNVQDKIIVADPQTLEEQIVFGKNYNGTPYSPNFSKDGKKILFSLHKHNEKSICIINSDGSNLEQILVGNFSMPIWRNDNEILMKKNLGGSGDVFLYNLKNKEQKRVSFNTIDESSISVSNDGNLLLISGQRESELIDLTQFDK